MVKAIVQTARGMGIKTIAEFVGDDATQRPLREFGVYMARGYRIGRPVDASGLSPSLAAQRPHAGWAAPATMGRGSLGGGPESCEATAAPCARSSAG